MTDAHKYKLPISLLRFEHMVCTEHLRNILRASNRRCNTIILSITQMST